MPNPTELAIGILISVIVTGGFMILQEQATRVAYFIVRQCAAQLTRHRERRQEEWLTQIDECPRGLSQIALATSNLGAVIKDQPSIPLMLFNLFVSALYLAARPIGFGITAAIALELGIRMVAGDLEIYHVGIFLFFAPMNIICLPKNKNVDFSWYPDWQIPDKLAATILLSLIAGLILVLFTGPLEAQIGAAIFLLLLVIARYRKPREATSY